MAQDNFIGKKNFRQPKLNKALFLRLLSPILSCFFCLFILSSCEKEPLGGKETRWKIISGREEKELYRVQVPKSWNEIELSYNRQDTTKPIAEWQILTGEGNGVRVSVHNFPRKKGFPLISPQAQVERWRGQFDHLDPTSFFIEPITHGGFVGLLFQGEGEIAGKERMVLANSMSLADELSEELDFFIKLKLKKEEMLSDYTIKAVGNPTTLSLKKEEILLFMKSFELVDDLPVR